MERGRCAHVLIVQKERIREPAPFHEVAGLPVVEELVAGEPGDRDPSRARARTRYAKPRPRPRSAPIGRRTALTPPSCGRTLPVAFRPRPFCVSEGGPRVCCLRSWPRPRRPSRAAWRDEHPRADDDALRLPARARRVARLRGGKRDALPRFAVVGDRRVPRRRRLLRAQRVPDHHAAHHRVGTAQADRPAGVLVAPRPAPAPGAGPGDGRDPVLRGDLRRARPRWRRSAPTASPRSATSANWKFIFAGQSYFDQFTQPSPFRHMWSLAIEEQFYLIWPLIVFGVLWFTPVGAGAARRARWR